jgi:hypothetical protein
MTIWRLANRDDSPRAVWRVGPNAFYAGEEVIDYFERTERWDAAERFAEAVRRNRQTQRFGRNRPGAD